MLLAVVSDTHLTWPDEALERVFEEHLLRADAVLHLGDIGSEATLAYFQRHPRFIAVAGNMDGMGVGDALPPTLTLKIEGLQVSMVHGFGLGRYIPDGARRLFNDEADIILFGHTHARFWKQDAEGPVFLNPGSLFHPRDDWSGFAWLKLSRGEMPQVSWQDITL